MFVLERGELYKGGRERSDVRRRIAAGADQEEIFRKSLWSALQTHLQGVDGATLAIVPEKCRHCAALLSRTSYVAKISGPAKEGKPCPRRLTSEKPERSRSRLASSNRGIPYKSDTV
jgi:hypothetical protein